MLDQAVDLLRRLVCILVAILGVAHTFIYYACATMVYSMGTIAVFLCCCVFCALSRTIAASVPITRWIDRRRQDDFVRKVKNMGYQELSMRARLLNSGEDVKMRNEANKQMLEEIRDAERFIMRVKYYKPMSRMWRYDVQPVIPSMFIPPHQTPAAPSPLALVRWWFSQDHSLHRLECSIAAIESQLMENRQRLAELDQEGEWLRVQLSHALERKRQVQHLPALPDYKRMFRNFEAALHTMRALKKDLPSHSCTSVCTCPPGTAASYPEWLVPPKRLEWWQRGLLVPGQTPPRATSLSSVADNWFASAPTVALYQPRPAAAIRVLSASVCAPSLPPLSGPPPSPDSSAPLAPPPPPVTHAASESLSTPVPQSTTPLADRLRDPAGVRARAPTPSPPASPLAYRSRF